jgi:hypothetical protein
MSEIILGVLLGLLGSIFVLPQTKSAREYLQEHSPGVYEAIKYDIYT